MAKRCVGVALKERMKMKSKAELQRYRQDLFDALMQGEDINELTAGMTAAEQRELNRHIGMVKKAYEQFATDQSDKQ